MRCATLEGHELVASRVNGGKRAGRPGHDGRRAERGLLRCDRASRRFSASRQRQPSSLMSGRPSATTPPIASLVSSRPSRPARRGPRLRTRRPARATAPSHARRNPAAPVVAGRVLGPQRVLAGGETGQVRPHVEPDHEVAVGGQHVGHVRSQVHPSAVTAGDNHRGPPAYAVQVEVLLATANSDRRRARARPSVLRAERPPKG